MGELFTLLGYATGGFVFWLAARQRKLSTQGVWLVAAWGLIGAVLVAKLTQLVAEGWPGHLPLATGFDPRNGGRALAGGLIGGWLGVEIAKRHFGLRRSTGDLFALALPAGEAVGRIGCFLNGCCFGTKCDLPWAVWQHGEWRHPAQLYSSVASLGLFLALVALRPKLSREGDLFKAYLIGFGALRFWLEFMRWRESLILGLSPMQWFCLQLVIGTTAWWAISAKSNVAEKPA